MRTTSARLSIAGLLAVVLLSGVGFAALASPSAFWLNTIFTLNVTLLVIALISLIFGRDPARRAFWAGFLIAGGTYLVLSRSWWLGENRVGEQLATTMLLDMLYAQIEPPSPPPAGPTMAMLSGEGMMGMGGGATMMGGYGAMRGGMPGGMMPGTAASPTPAPPPPSRWSSWAKPDRATQYYPISAAGTVLQSPFAFLRIGHSLFSLLFGIMGGLLARSYRRGTGARDGESIG